LSVRLVPVTWQVRLVMREAHYDRSTIDPAAVREYAASLGSPGGRHALHQVALGIVPPDIDAFIRGYQTIAAPALVIWGRHDRIVPIATGQALAGALPSARLAILENVGHLPQEERPSDTLALMREFLTAP
jgi:pimeloyl-ACP methyl ester carboxylesterase